MTSAIRRLIILGLGLLAGLAAWTVMELLVLVQGEFPSFLTFTLLSGALFGMIFGAFFASAQGIIAGNRRRIRGAALVGAGIGLVGGALGFLAGQGVLFLLGELVFARARERALVGLPVARIVGWAILGVVVGSAEGIRARSGLKLGMGLAGGLLGGMLGGAAVEYARIILPGVSLARLVGLVLFGLLLAGSYALIERRLSHGVLRLLNGAHKGSEYILNQQRFTLGSGMTNDIVLSGYRNVADSHARIWSEGGELRIAPVEGSAIRVNDEEVAQSRLRYEDVVRIGTAKLFYRPQ